MNKYLFSIDFLFLIIENYSRVTRCFLDKRHGLNYLSKMIVSSMKHNLFVNKLIL